MEKQLYERPIIADGRVWVAYSSLELRETTIYETVPLSIPTAPAKPSLNDLTTELASVGKWYDLGLKLGITSSQLKEIEEDYHDQKRRKSEMLDRWLRNGENCSWEAIAKALSQIEEQEVANEIRKKYYSSLTANGKYQGVRFIHAGMYKQAE